MFTMIFRCEQTNSTRKPPERRRLVSNPSRFVIKYVGAESIHVMPVYIWRIRSDMLRLPVMLMASTTSSSTLSAILFSF